MSRYSALVRDVPCSVVFDRKNRAHSDHSTVRRHEKGVIRYVFGLRVVYEISRTENQPLRLFPLNMSNCRRRANADIGVDR